MPEPSPAADPASSPRAASLWVWWIAGAVAAAIVVPAEVHRWQALTGAGSVLQVLFHWNIDTTPYLAPLLILPVLLVSRSRPAVVANIGSGRPSSRTALLGGTLFVAALSLAMSLWVAQAFDDLPPAFHDEYSYLFQARTFLAGRTWFPSAPEPRLFDQMHILNEGRFASRYFPGAGAWLAPFVSIGHPCWGQWLAGMLCAALALHIGHTLAGLRAGLIAGTLATLSPGLALFSNLLLAHHPTLVGQMLFVWAFLRNERSPHAAWRLLSGTGLAFAMLCRPMTALGIALPFGVLLLLRIVSSWMQRPSSRPPLLSSLIPFAVPLLVGFALLAWYSREITGSLWVSPYQQYTDVYTPRHVYGFNNVVRGERHVGPRVIDKYDRWAENLTPALATRNVRDRIIASGQWTLGLVPLAMTLVFLILGWPRRRPGTGLLLASIASLHLVHVPYWFVGIMNWHYVFESAPLWLVLVGVVTHDLLSGCAQMVRRGLTVWWLAVLVLAVVVNLSTFEPAFRGRLWQGVDEIHFAREKHGRFAAEIARVVRRRPAIVLVRDDPSDRHIEPVTNDPDLSGPVLIAHWLKEVPPARVRSLYPDRTLYLYDAQTGTWTLPTQ